MIMHFHENILKQISNSTKGHHLALEFRFSSVQAQVVQVHFRSGLTPKNQDLNGKSGQNMYSSIVFVLFPRRVSDVPVVHPGMPVGHCNLLVG